MSDARNSPTSGGRRGDQEEIRGDDRVILSARTSGFTGATPLDVTESLLATPITENGFTGMCIGAALTGLRPIVDLTIASFVYLAADQIINQAAKLRYMTGGQPTVPIVFRTSMCYNGSNAAHHGDRPYPLFMNVPGLKVVAPATPADTKGLLKSAIRDDDPVLVFEDMDLWTKSAPCRPTPSRRSAWRRSTGTAPTSPSSRSRAACPGAGRRRPVGRRGHLGRTGRRAHAGAAGHDDPVRVGSEDRPAVVVDPAHRLCRRPRSPRSWPSTSSTPCAPVHRVTTPAVPSRSPRRWRSRCTRPPTRSGPHCAPCAPATSASRVGRSPVGTPCGWDQSPPCRPTATRPGVRRCDVDAGTARLAANRFSRPCRRRR